MAQEISYHYGDFTHEPGEVVDMRWEELPNHTRRGWRDTVLKRCTLMVQLQACDQGSLAAKINALSEAYSVNEKKFYIGYADGSTTRHVLDPENVNSIRGPRVCAFELPDAKMEQLVIQRDFVITIEQLFEAAENQIIEYTENFTNIGGQRAWRVQNVVNGLPRSYTVWERTSTTIIQEGSAVGFAGWYVDGAFPTPLIEAQYEHLDRRVIEVGSPIHMGHKWLYYPLRWRYVFTVPTYMIAYPTGNQPLYTNGYYVPIGTTTPIAPWGYPLGF